MTNQKQLLIEKIMKQVRHKISSIVGPNYGCACNIEVERIIQDNLPDEQEENKISNKEIQDIWDWSRYEAGNFEILIDLLQEKGLLKD